jgi:hypothetical protein
LQEEGVEEDRQQVQSEQEVLEVEVLEDTLQVLEVVLLTQVVVEVEVVMVLVLVVVVRVWSLLSIQPQILLTQEEMQQEHQVVKLG